MSFAPMLSLVAATRLTTFTIDALIKEFGLIIPVQCIAYVTPGLEHLHNTVADADAECLVVARQKNYENALHLSMDAANKDRIHRMVKEIARWDIALDQLFCLPWVLMVVKELMSILLRQ